MMIAAILTCHNRKEKTLACLRSLYHMVPSIDVYLTDDGCTDGTSDIVQKEFPNTHIIPGNGNLFWSRGMYMAWVEAIKGEYDYYLWLNDDVELYENFMDELMKCEKLGHNNCIVSGLIADKVTHKIIYGGTDKKKVLHGESATPQEILYMNGNVVLIPRSIVETIGIMDPVFHHDLGDVDYGLTAIEHGVKIYATRKPIAIGYINNYCRVRKWNTSLLERWRRLYSPLGSNPKINFYFRKKHFGIINAVSYYLYLHILNLMPDSLVVLFFGKTYIDK